MVMILKFLFNKIFVFLTFLVKGNVEVKDIHHWFTKASSKGDYNMLLCKIILLLYSNKKAL